MRSWCLTILDAAYHLHRFGWSTTLSLAPRSIIFITVSLITWPFSIRHVWVWMIPCYSLIGLRFVSCFKSYSLSSRYFFIFARTFFLYFSNIVRSDLLLCGRSALSIIKYIVLRSLTKFIRHYINLNILVTVSPFKFNLPIMEIPLTASSLNSIFYKLGGWSNLRLFYDKLLISPRYSNDT